jgi:hypothetical protein
LDPTPIIHNMFVNMEKFQYDPPRAAFPWEDSMDRATEISKLRELTDDQLSVVGGGSAIWGGVGGAISLSWLGPVGIVSGFLIGAYLFSPGKAG